MRNQTVAIKSAIERMTVATQGDVSFLSRIANHLGRLVCQATQDEKLRRKLKTTKKHSLSNAKVIQYLEQRSGAPSLSLSSLKSHPECYRMYRALKFLVEGFSGDIDETQRMHAALIAEVRSCSFGTALELQRENPELYRRVLATKCAKAIWLLSGFGKRKHYIYASDQWLVDKCGEYQRFTELKRADCPLHREIMGRGLSQDVVLAHPSFATHYHVGLNSEIYRSIPELAVGNWFVHAQIDCEREKSISLNGAPRVMFADFYFSDCDLHLELLQNVESIHNRRRESYVERTKRKKRLYRDAHMEVVYVSSDEYFSNGALNAIAFCNEIRDRCAERDLILPSVPDEHILMTVFNDEKSFLVQAPREQVIEHLLEVVGIEGVADFQNSHSSLRTLLRSRRDFRCIQQAVRRRGAALKSERCKARHAERREKYVPLEQVKTLIRDHDIRSQPAWYAFCKKNKSLLAKGPIPVNLPDVYKLRGEWKGWGDLWPK